MNLTDIKQKHVELEVVKDDPRINRDGRKIVKAKGGGRNTESFDPKSTLVRPEMRILIGPNRDQLDRKIKHDDVVIVPEFFCKEDDWSIYYKLVEEMREAQASGLNKSEWISWHEGAHLISMNPTGSPTFNAIQEKISKYFGINNAKVGTRFNWYKDGSDWKPFHHDSAAFNPQRARNQNITVGVSFGSSRELSFLNAKNGSRIYFPQNNGMMFSFGRDVNIKWKHGINALSQEEISAGGANSLGRVSIILWGLCPLTIEEADSPPILDDNTRGNGHSVHARPPHEHGRNQNEQRDDRRDDAYRDDPRSRDTRERHDSRGGDSRDDRRDYRRYDRSDNRRDDRTDNRRDCSPHQGQRGGQTDHRDRRQDSRDIARDQGREQRREDRAPADERCRERSQERHARSDTQRVEKRSASPSGGAAGPVCRDFRRGSCRFGDRCRFQHSD